MKQNIGLIRNDNMDDTLAYKMHTVIMKTVQDIDSVQFAYLRSIFFSVLFGFAGIAFLLTRNITLFYMGISVLFVGFSVLLIVTFFCLFNLFYHVQVICNSRARAEQEEKYKQLSKLLNNMLETKRRYWEINLYIPFAFCFIIIIGFSSYLIINNDSPLWVCLIVFSTIVILCLYAFSLRKVVGYFEKRFATKSKK